MNANMKVSEQCRIVASKSNQVIGLIRINITDRENGLIVRTFIYSNNLTSLKILHPCVEAISKEDRHFEHRYAIQKIQMRATKLIPGLRYVRYEERHDVTVTCGNIIHFYLLIFRYVFVVVKAYLKAHFALSV